MNWFLYAFQDLRKQKSKAIFGIGGSAISIMLLTIIGSLGDSLSYSNISPSLLHLQEARISCLQRQL